MKYAKAHDVLPEEIVKIIQEYVDGKYLYGTTINELTQKYYLSEKSIRRIISEEKHICSELFIRLSSYFK